MRQFLKHSKKQILGGPFGISTESSGNIRYLEIISSSQRHELYLIDNLEIVLSIHIERQEGGDQQTLDALEAELSTVEYEINQRKLADKKVTVYGHIGVSSDVSYTQLITGKLNDPTLHISTDIGCNFSYFHSRQKENIKQCEIEMPMRLALTTIINQQICRLQQDIDNGKHYNHHFFCFGLGKNKQDKVNALKKLKGLIDADSSNKAEQLSKKEWEILANKTTGRALSTLINCEEQLKASPQYKH